MYEKTVVLTFDDAVSNHARFVAPLLRKLGFHATFFICEFPPDFATNKQQYMTWEEIRSLHEYGFELGNHTLNHTGVEGIALDAFERELDAVEERFSACGLPRARAFAYPGGPGSEHVYPVLKRKGYHVARSVGARLWNPAQDNPLLVPCYPVHGDGSAFRAALTETRPDSLPVLVYHGVPEHTHPWVDTAPAVFEEEMYHLAREGYRVLSFCDVFNNYQ